MHMKTRKAGKKRRKRRGVEVNPEAVRILRTLNEREGFHFYEGVGRPTEANARSLSDFLEKTGSVKLESLIFHLERKDFQNWVKKTLGDARLARRMGRIRPSNDDELRIRIHAAVEDRIKELRE